MGRALVAALALLFPASARPLAAPPAATLSLLRDDVREEPGRVPGTVLVRDRFSWSNGAVVQVTRIEEEGAGPAAWLDAVERAERQARLLPGMFSVIDLTRKDR